MNDFSEISNNITEICRERTDSYSRSGTSAGGLLGGAIGGFLGDGRGSRGESAGSFLGSIIGGAIGEALADSRNRSDIAEAKAYIKKMLNEWKKNGLPIIESYLETYSESSKLHNLEVQYYIDNSEVFLPDMTEDSVKRSTYLLRQCIASQFRENYDVALGNNIVRYFNNYSRHLSNLETFEAWQNKFLYVDKTSCFKTAYDNVVNEVKPLLHGVCNENFEKVLTYYAAEVPAFLGIDQAPELFEDAEYKAMRYAESSISGKDNQMDYGEDYLRDSNGYQMIVYSTLNSFKTFSDSIIKPRIRKMEIIAGIGLPIFMLLNLIIKIYRWFSISSAFFRFFLCRYWGNVLSYIILSQIVILIAVLIKKKELASEPLDWKGFWKNYNVKRYYIREKTYETELQLPPLEIKTRKTRAKKTKGSQPGGDVLSDDELLKLAGK